MENTTDKKDCTNCKYYIEHYVFSITSEFRPIGGHCTNRTLNYPRKKNRGELQDNCEYWEINKEVKAKRRKTIKEVLRSMETHLLHIRRILDIDED